VVWYLDNAADSGYHAESTGRITFGVPNLLRRTESVNTLHLEIHFVDGQAVESRKELGLRIRRLRGQKGLTAKALAEMAGLSASYLSEVEKGISAISTEKLQRIAKELGLTLDQMVNRTESAVSQTPTNAIQIPMALSQAAEELNLSFHQTKRLLGAGTSLVAARGSSSQGREYSKEQWIKLFERVKPFMED
jgi:transcriptional regulator with XRE-family HTH domain